MSKKIKILHILWSGGIGGAEEYITSLIRGFDDYIFDIHLCFLSKKGAIFEEALKMKHQVVFIGMKNGWDFLGALKFYLYLNKEKFDIIHTHPRNFLTTMIMSLYSTPKVITHHLGAVDGRLLKKNRFYYRLFSRVFRKIIVISEAVKRNLIKDLGIRREDKIKVIYNGIDLRKFNAARNVISPDLVSVRQKDRYVVGFIGRMESYKRPVLFVSIAMELLKQSEDFYFLMVGDGPELDKCRDVIHQHNIEASFQLLGYRRDIPAIISLFDALIFTSEGEGFGIVLLEAMALGIPVFAINDGAVDEIILHRKNGILIDSVDPARIACQILETISDRELIANIKHQCVIDVQDRFSIEKSVEKTAVIYRELTQ